MNNIVADIRLLRDLILTKALKELDGALFEIKLRFSDKCKYLSIFWDSTIILFFFLFISRHKEALEFITLYTSNSNPFSCPTVKSVIPECFPIVFPSEINYLTFFRWSIFFSHEIFIITIRNKANILTIFFISHT